MSDKKMDEVKNKISSSLDGIKNSVLKQTKIAKEKMNIYTIKKTREELYLDLGYSLYKLYETKGVDVPELNSKITKISELTRLVEEKENKIQEMNLSKDGKL